MFNDHTMNATKISKGHKRAYDTFRKSKRTHDTRRRQRSKSLPFKKNGISLPSTIKFKAYGKGEANRERRRGEIGDNANLKMQIKWKRRKGDSPTRSKSPRNNRYRVKNKISKAKWIKVLDGYIIKAYEKFKGLKRAYSKHPRAAVGCTNYLRNTNSKKKGTKQQANKEYESTTKRRHRTTPRHNNRHVASFNALLLPKASCLGGCVLGDDPKTFFLGPIAADPSNASPNDWKKGIGGKKTP
ncbi:hypothetical protein L195_g026553 [Trifolium pratense]|uniref:Uncharacterized protein n=1 Tax=Trifolium pratense TaxID=57577 RepID=A0A2K3NJK8_TRIPR|nr:hypothetical protein L195_g026553 [Trifolium pratense]